MLLKPWYDVIHPHKQLQEGIVPEASEFAVHLEKVRDGLAIEEYTQPTLFFTRTYLTPVLRNFVTEVVRRLSGESVETNAVYQLMTQLGGGKTHALTLLYHLAWHGSDSHKWPGVKKILTEARISAIPKTKTVVFVGDEFTSMKGRGGRKGEPFRKTLWGEMAFQLGGEALFAAVAEQDATMIAPEPDLMQTLLPQNAPCLILIDELLSYLRQYRGQGIADQLERFLADLSAHLHKLTNVVLVVAMPSREPDMNAEDLQEMTRYRTLFEQIGKSVVLSSEIETAEIIRRRLFDWDLEEMSPDEKILLPEDAIETCQSYAAWVQKHRVQLPSWFPFDTAEQAFMDTYPFHPSVISVFERKWQTLPHFQRTRGILRLLALLVASAYKEGQNKAYPDPLISLGSAPLSDHDFRMAIREQLGDDGRLEVPIMTDVGGNYAFAARLDNDAPDEIKHNRLNMKTATTIFFESNGGMTGVYRADAAEPDIHLAVGEPDINISDVETVLEALGEHCYFLTREDKQYRFNLTPNLNKLFDDRSPRIDAGRITEHVEQEIKKVFAASNIAKLFPTTSTDIPDRPVLTLAVLSPEYTRNDPETLQLIESITTHYGNTFRTFRSALIWAIADDETRLRENVRRLLTWQEMSTEFQSEAGEQTEGIGPENFEQIKLMRTIAGNIEKTQKHLQEIVWQTYRHVALLNKENRIEFLDLGCVHAGSASSLAMLILNHLRLYDYLADSVSPRFLTRSRYWPEDAEAWSTRGIRDMFFMSPQFPRILNVNVLKEAIAKGVSTGLLAYVGKKVEGVYTPFYYNKPLNAEDIEISDELFILPQETADEYLLTKEHILTSLTVDAPELSLIDGEKITFTLRALDQNGEEINRNVKWEASGGKIDQNGVLVVNEGNGSDVVVKATAGNKTAWGRITLLSKQGEPRELSRPDEDHGVKETTQVAWTGEVPIQQWPDFYAEVLARFPENHRITITVNIEISKDSGIAQEHVETLKTALQRLGLSEQVEERHI